ncbi:MAG: SagB/ThcOx family dehydrogenase [Proteobacteria bacterium]|nr:SagB/ThcOx family dehydrogenase [Pseudomonadota bacterium]
MNGTDPKEKIVGIGARFQEETKYTRESLKGHTLDWNAVPDTYKHYDNPLARIVLPKPVTKGEKDIWKLIARRRSRRDYNSRDVLDLEALAVLLWATQGITTRWGDTLFRAAPSAGGLFPVETYLNVRSADRLESGIYHFRPAEFDLELIRKGNFSKGLAEAALGQDMVAGAQVTFIWSAVLARAKWKYRERAYRYIYLDAGHIAQNLYLAGEALGFGVCAVGAFFDDEVNGFLGLDGIEETVIYMAAVGKLPETEKNV